MTWCANARRSLSPLLMITACVVWGTGTLIYAEDASIKSAPGTRSGNVRYPDVSQVTLLGRLAPRYQGNIRYLKHIYDRETKGKDWMLSPFRNRESNKIWTGEYAWTGKYLWVGEYPWVGEYQWAGEYAGKWLDAASLVAADTGDKGLAQRVSAFAAAFRGTQESDGYLGIEGPTGKGKASWDVWNMWYAMTGLLTHADCFENPESLRAAVRCAEWLVNQFDPVSESNKRFFRGAHHGGCNVDVIDQFVRLYRATQDRRFLDFAMSVVRHYPPIRKARETGKAPLVHPYVLFAYLGGVVELATENEREEDLAWVERVWEDLVERHLYPTGSLGYNESLRKSASNDHPAIRGKPKPEGCHQETCATVEWLLLNARLYRATGKVRYIQKMEHTIYNALLAAQSADGMKWMYYTPLRYEKRWFSGETNCCYWSGPRGIARLPRWVYALDGEGIRVNLYESSEATLRLDGHVVTIKQSSLYPDKGKVALQILPDEALSFTLRLRIPDWSSEIRVSLNGLPFREGSRSEGYYRIHRKWSARDQIMLEFDIPTCVRPFLNDQYGVLVRGPEVLAVDQRDNRMLDVDAMALQKRMSLKCVDPVNGRRRYRGEAIVKDQLVQVVFTPYADCGGEGSQFRTAFPLASRTQRKVEGGE